MAQGAYLTINRTGLRQLFPVAGRTLLRTSCDDTKDHVLCVSYANTGAISSRCMTVLSQL